MKHGHLFQDTQLGRRAIAMLKVTIVMYRATGCAVLRRAVLKSNVSCRVELYRALLHCGSSRPWRRNPDRTDLGSKLELPERIARASCSRNARGARPARAQDQIQFRSPRSRHPHKLWSREWTDRSAADQNATNCVKTNRNDTNRDEGRTDPNRSETKQTKTGESRVRFGSPS